MEMDPEIKKELAEVHALVKDNHQMLRAIRRGQKFSFWSKIIFWTVVIVIPFLVYQHYLQPFVSQFSPTGTSTPSKSPFGGPSFEEIQKLINLYTGKETVE